MCACARVCVCVCVFCVVSLLEHILIQVNNNFALRTHSLPFHAGMPNASTWAPEAAVAKQFGASEGASGAVAELCWHPIALDGPAVRQRIVIIFSVAKFLH